MHQSDYLSAEQLNAVLESFGPGATVEVVRIRYKNRREIRRSEQMSVEALRALIVEAMDEGHQYGGDLEVPIPALGKILVGHHDAVYWLEPRA